MIRRNLGILLLAALLIAVGAVLIGINFFGWNPFWFAGWWTLPIMALAVMSMIAHKPNFWNGMMLGTAVLLFVRMQNYLELDRPTITWQQFAAAEVALALILLGVVLIVRMMRPRKETPPQVASAPPAPPPPAPGSPPPPGAGAPPPPAPPPAYAGRAAGTPASGEPFPTRFAVFSSDACRSDCRQLKGGRFSAIFGNVTANLTQADFVQPVTVEANTLFGGVDIITPPGVRIECAGTSIFGNCDARAVTGRPYNPAHPPLTIRYLNVFGGVNVK